MNFKSQLKSIKLEREDIKEQKLFTPSRLSKSVKKTETYEKDKELKSLKKKEQEIKEKVKKKKQFSKKLDKVLKKPITSKRILKKEQAGLTIPTYKKESVLADPQRFFKSEMEEVKRTLFFS